MSELNDQFESFYDLEARIIGGVLAGEGANFKDFDLRVSDFEHPSFQIIFEKMQFLFDRQKCFDVWSVEYLLRDDVVARQALWFAYEIGGLSPRLVPGWLPFLFERATERLFLEVAELLRSGVSADEKIAETKSLQDRVVRSVHVAPDLKHDLQMTLNEILNPKRAMATCFPRLDDLIVGLKGGRLYVVGARPSVGKSLFGMQLAWSMSKQRGVLFASWEMSKHELLKRVYAQELNIQLDSLERGELSTSDKQRIQDLIVRAEEQLIMVDDPKMTVQGLRSYLLNIRKTRDVDVVVVDYLQLIHAGWKFKEKREEIEAVTIELKNIAREFDVAVVALAQLNRGAKPDEPPQLADFKGSGQIEQEADVVVLLHRKESEYDKDSNFDRVASGLDPIRNLMVLDVAKNRHGASGGFVMAVLGHYSRLGVH